MATQIELLCDDAAEGKRYAEKHQASRLRKALRVGALMWIISSLLPAGTVLLAAGEFVSLPITPIDVLMFGGVVSALLFIASFLVPNTQSRVLASSLPLGICLSSVVFLTIGVGGTFLLIPTVPLEGKLLSCALFVGAATVASAWMLNGYRSRMSERRFMEREFLVESDRVVFRQPIKTRLDAPQSGDKTIFGKLFSRLGFYMLAMVPMAYPIQRLLSESGGVTALLLFLAALCIPLAIYFIGRLTCATYLFVFKIWQMERQHGKPVVFDIAE
jgi:hypothetical protein